LTEIGRPARPWDRTPPTERAYFELLGPGLVAVLAGQRPGGEGEGGWRPPTGGAWVHVGEDGRATAFSGKAEVGQGTRLALTLVVAEELRLPAADVRMVMGDTDLCPWDMGTFGSRSMPDAVPALAVASAGAREALLRRAAEGGAVRAGELEAVAGSVRRRNGALVASYADLVRGRRELVQVDPAIARAPPSTWTVAGRPADDPGAEEVVTGRRRYASDLVRPGLLHGAVLWPPSYGARLRDVVLPPPSPSARVRFVRDGEFVGAVGPSPLEARAALRGLSPSWETTPQPTEASIEAYLRAHPAEGDDWDTDQERVGDVEAALGAARWTLRATYRSAYIAHVPLEPHCALAAWEGDRLTVWVGTQTPFRVRGELARALGLPEDDVRVVVPPTGAGFGGKHGATAAVAAARLARAAGRPVRVAFSREEEFEHGYLRPMSVVDVRAGLAPSGELAAWEFFNLNGGAAALRPPYRVPNLTLGNTLTRSPLPQGSLRALAANPNTFARESAIDELCRLAALDPLDFRERNLADDRLRTVLRRAADRARWSARPRSPGHGFGLAVGLEKGSRVATVAEVSVAGRGQVHVERLVSAFEAGAIVHPENLRSQVEGAQTMALGEALYEAVHFDAGVLTNPRLSQYRVPRFSDLPELDVELIDLPSVPPAGAGETPMISVAPAVASALYDASGVRLRALPLLPSGRLPAAPAG
jgi:nicotinate dehydrogenase subunit B